MNISSLTYQQKNRILIISFFLVLGIASLTSFRQSIILNRQNGLLKIKIQQAKNAPAKIRMYKERLESLNNTISYLDSSSDLRKELLSVVGNLSEANKVLFREFLPPESFINGDIMVDTHEIILEGNYHSLLMVIHQIESELTLGKLTSSRFLLEFDRVKRSESLICHIYIQSIKNQNQDGV